MYHDVPVVVKEEALENIESKEFVDTKLKDSPLCGAEGDVEGDIMYLRIIQPLLVLDYLL